jgi:hypothetical protein
MDSCLYMTLETMINRSNAKFEPIVKDEKGKERQYFCVACGLQATQTALIKTDGATIVERYCDACASKYNQSTS